MNKQTIEIIDGKMKPMDGFKLINNKFKYIAMDKDGEWFAAEEKPLICLKMEMWGFDDPSDGYIKPSIGFIFNHSMVDYTGDWKDSLHERTKELKPVNNNCCGKNILVHTIEGWFERILVYCGTAPVTPVPGFMDNPKNVYFRYDRNVYWFIDSADEENFIKNKSSVKIIGWNLDDGVRRCPDVIYGDENE